MPTPTPKKKAVGYIRVSTPDQAKEGESLATQKKAIVRYAELNGWHLTDVYEDGGYSGAKRERPALKRLMDAAHAKKFEVLIIYKLSRFARSARDTLNLVHELKQCGVNFATVTEKIDLSSEYGQFFLTVLGALAELERTIIKEQMAVNKMARWRDLRCYIGKPPFAYRWNKDAKKIEVDEKEVKIFHEILDMRLNRGMSHADICIELNKRGLRGRHGRRWAKTTTAGMLKNRAYLDEHYVNKHKYEGKHRTGEMNPESEWILFPVPPLLDHATFDRLQEISEFNKVKSKRAGKTTVDRWLRDVLICGECGGRVKPHRGSKRKDGTYPEYYACYWNATSTKKRALEGREKCHLPHVKAQELEDLVWWRLMVMLNIHGPRSESTLEKILFDGSAHDRTLAELKERSNATLASIKDYERKRKHLNRLLSLKDLDDDELGEYRSQARENREDLARAKEALAAVENEINAVRHAAAEQQKTLEFLRENKRGLKELRAEIEAFTPAQKKELVESMLDGPIVLWAGSGDSDDGLWNEKIRFRPNYMYLNRLIKNTLGKDSPKYINLIELILPFLNNTKHIKHLDGFSDGSQPSADTSDCPGANNYMAKV